MTAPETGPTLPEKGPLSIRMSPEQRAALEWLQRVFPEKYPGVGSVLNDYSLREAESAWRRAQLDLVAVIS